MMLKEAIAELKRELAIRERVFPEWIRAGKISTKTATHRIDCIRWAIARLEEMQSEVTEEVEQPTLF